MNSKCLTAIAMVFLSGCSTIPKDVPHTELTFSSTSASQDQIAHAWQKLAASAEKASDAATILAQLENGYAAKNMRKDDYNSYLFQNSYVPVGMERDVPDLNWNGPAMPVLKMMADLSGYRIDVSANTPLRQPYIRINTADFQRQVNVIDIIRAIDTANKDILKIDIIESPKIIKISYLV
ncbi:DotD/TraH family lipoprotein [Photobacterium kishitanii]|uniref:DotD/TraH family lipoprotein n=1 Tax=Photobacterium kishitanii TaxID=318456 RepID=A0A2T3KN32_9GAMM|nr:DotD/TraH family lipoprotein [Photobacterium kishitanii]PSV01182.1 hypothetical protein C9J27_03930 [Photobacterium kishitanii]